MTENETIYKCIIGLLNMNQPDVLAKKDDIRRIFTQAIAEGSKVDEEVQNELKQVLQSL